MVQAPFAVSILPTAVSWGKPPPPPAPGCCSAAEPNLWPPCESRKEKQDSVLSWLSRSNKLPQAKDHSNMNTVCLLLTGRKYLVFIHHYKSQAVSTLNFCCYRYRLSGWISGKTSYSFLSCCHLEDLIKQVHYVTSKTPGWAGQQRNGMMCHQTSK